LAEAAAHGDRAAQSLLFERERPLVARLARELARDGLAEQDLRQEGALGLLAAIAGFAGSGRPDFDLYAEECVRASMAEASAAEGAARAEADRLVTAAADFERTELLLTRELKRVPSQAEIAAKLEWSEARVQAVATMVDEARRQHDEELEPFLDPDYFDPLEWMQEDGAGGDG
jgi:RNA polymerase primary sigma factor